MRTLSWNRLSRDDVRRTIDDELTKFANSVDDDIEELQKRLIQLKKLHRIYKPMLRQFKRNTAHSESSQRHMNTTGG